MSAAKVTICDPVEDSRERTKQLLLNVDTFCLEADCSRYEFYLDVVKQTKPNVAIVASDSNPEKSLELIRQISAACPGCGVVVISSSKDGQFILKAVRAGAREFVESPVEVQELLSALNRVSASGGQSNRLSAGSIIAVAGASGGVGTTSVAVNLACAIAALPDKNVALVDLDLSLGDADVFLDSIPEYTLLDVAQNVSRLDLSLLKKSLTKHESGVYLLPRPVQLHDVDTISAEDFSKVLKLLQASFTHVVVDLSKSYVGLDIVALNAAEHILLLTQLDLPCLRNVVRLIMSLDAFEGITDKIKIVVNRFGLENAEISLKKAEQHIGREIFAQIPNNYAVVSECRNNGVPLLQTAPKANITRSIQELAIRLVGGNHELDVAEAPVKKDKKSLFGFLSKSGN
ncbi:MAG TPA: AAA family ATPase [Pirellulaceae bacterium]|nr:AAA family ATPase [Pirellulaceae bacterium]HMO92088.1 AAA family ATPase [Pirellulaceae bacterium]HMP69324.1 AAA family ATPase [Pirellulaceae bacterium]